MKTREFLTRLQHGEIVRAIRQAERKTSGEIRVFVSRQPVVDAVAAAQEHFLELGMQHTRERNGVLIFVAPRVRKFAVIGDTAVHTRCGESFWLALATEISGHFQRGEFTSGIVHAVNRAGDLLAQHFPRRPEDENELPDNIASD